MKKFHQKQAQSCTGNALVEFALVLPVLLMLVFGIVELSLALYDKAIITNASREAARAGVIFRVPALTNAQISAIATDYCTNNLVTFGGASQPNVTVTNTGGTTAGNELKITVTYQYTGLLLGDMISVFTGAKLLSASTTMIYE
jgi:Flp pilus assembly protein TadG